MRVGVSCSNRDANVLRLAGAPLDVTKVKGFDTLRLLCVRTRKESCSKAWKARVRLRRKIDLVKYA